jgi:type VI secretion system protein ImpI
MTLGLVLRVYGDGQSFDRTFPRPPVLIGREPGPSRCVLDDPRVSKLHASIDIRGGSLWVRDAGSTNGTFAAGQRLEPNRWIPIGPVQHPVELRVSTWRIQAFACEVDAADPSLRSATLGELLAGAPRSASMLAAAAAAPGFGGPPEGARAAGPSQPPPPAEEPPRTLYAPEVRAPHQATYDMRAPVAQIAPVYARLITAMNELYVATTRELDAMPPAARPHVCRQIAAAYPIVALDPSFQALFRHYGYSGSTPPPASPGGGAAASALAARALDALQDLAGWYVGRARPLATEADVTAFKEKLRAAMDELIVGYVPLLAGMMRFEHQMALRSDDAGASPLPASPTEMAARLLDWKDGTDDLVVRLRGSFADLMMHQVALLNGVMSGVKALLTELAPGTIEKAAMREQGRRSWLARLFSRVDAWDLYKRRHSDLADEENERFRLLFGAEFADEYRQFVKEARDAGGEARPGLFPSSPPPPGALPPAGASGSGAPRGPTFPPGGGSTLHSPGHGGDAPGPRPGQKGAQGSAKGTGQRPGNSGTR